MIQHRTLIPFIIIAALGATIIGYSSFSPSPPAPTAQQAGPENIHEPAKVISSYSEANTVSLVSEPIAEADEPPPLLPEPFDGKGDSYSKRLPKLFEQRRNNANTFITREDLPPELQQQLDTSLEYYKQNGYLQTNDIYVGQMNGLYNHISPIDLNDPALLIEVENIDNTPLAQLNYVGAIPDRIPDRDDLPIAGVRRVFQQGASYISLYEANLTTSEALLQKEFVNQSVKGYPATQMTYCGPSGGCVTTLSWLTNEKRYEMSLSGYTEANGDINLVTLANTLNIPLATTQNTETVEQ